MKTDRQYFLFRIVKTDRGAVSLKEEPFFHIEIVSGKTRLMIPVEILLSAGRLVDGLTVTERKLIRKMLGGIIGGSGEVQGRKEHVRSKVASPQR